MIIYSASIEGQRKQYPAIDIIKYICMLLIVSGHIPPFWSFNERFPITKDLEYYWRNYLARIAVPFFFAAAGFFLFGKIDFDKFDASIPEKYVLKLLRLLGIWTILLFVGHNVHLWYIGALVVAVSLSSILLYKGVSLKKMLIIASVLYLIGLLGNPYYRLLISLQDNKIIHHAIKSYFKLFETTRNGFFMGFPFLLIGALVAKKKISIKARYAFGGFLISMIVLFFEAFLIRSWNISKSRDVDMYLFLIPATLFLLLFAVNVPVNEKRNYCRLRIVIKIVFFSHLFVNHWLSYVWKAINLIFGVDIFNSLLNYLLVIIIATALGVAIDKLSKKKGFSFLRYLYL